MTFAPIVLFAYNRPWHLAQTLQALSNNKLAIDSELYIYCDGAKPGATEEQLAAVEETRGVARSATGFKSVKITERDENFGLARSIISGVTEIVERFGRVIVLEDDIVTSPGFLQYMNDALNLYADVEKVMHISGYWFPVKDSNKLPATFFYNTASCWGWGTWARAWKHLNQNVKLLMEKIKEVDPCFVKFNIENGFPFLDQLIGNASGDLNTWAIKWYASMFLQGGFSLHPRHSLTNNIGHDASGVHGGLDNRFYWTELAEHVDVKNIELKESTKARRLIKDFYMPKASLRSIIGRVLAPEFKQFVRRKFFDKDVFKEVRKLERFKQTVVKFESYEIKIVDNASFFFMYEEIFKKEIYKFKSNESYPLIIDGGANIGLATMYFKREFPEARVIAFEPDPMVFQVLKENVENNGITDVELINKGLWNKNAKHSFWQEGADGSRLDILNKDHIEEFQIEVVSLKPYLEEEVDLLKLDIEGAETEVLEDIKESLGKVKRIFVEYHSFRDKPQSLGQVINILQESGFRLQVNSPGVSNHSPFWKIHSYNGMDMQLNIWGLR